MQVTRVVWCCRFIKYTSKRSFRSYFGFSGDLGGRELEREGDGRGETKGGEGRKSQCRGG